MRTLIKPILLLVLASLVGCAAPGHITAGDPSLISIGMTKDEVVKKLGKPENVNADGQSEVFSYILERPWWQDKPFHVKMVDGKVVSYEVQER